MNLLTAEMEDQPVLAQLQARCATLPSSGRLGERECEVIYLQAHTLFQRGLTVQATEIFSLLNLYRPLNTRYLLANAICHKLLCRFDMAATMFHALMIIDEHDPVPALHLAQCLFALERPELAELALQRLLAMAAGRPEYAELTERAMLWLNKPGEQDD